MYSVFSFEYYAGILHLAGDKMYLTFLFQTHYLFCISYLDECTTMYTIAETIF